MCQSGVYLIAIDENAHVRFRFQSDCESWDCEECRKILTRRWRKRIYMHIKIKTEIHKEKFYFVTLTSNKDSVNTYSDTRIIWNTLMQNFRRRQKGLSYCAVWEPHTSGRYHIHLITNAAFLSKTYTYVLNNYKPMRRSPALDQILNRYNQLGWVHHVDTVDDPVHASRYLSKYLAKSFDNVSIPKRHRRVLTSRDWWHEPYKYSPYTYIKVPDYIYSLKTEDLQAWVDLTY